MNFQLLRAYRTHELELDSKVYQVRPMDVEAALLTVHYSEKALKGDEEALQIIREEAKRTLPRLLYWKLFGLRFSPRRAVMGTVVMTQLVALGIDQKDEAEDSLSPEARYKKSMHAFRSTAWNAHIADAAFHLQMTPRQVLREPWPAFLAYIEMTGALRARTEISLIAAKSLPYIESEGERNKAFTALYERAGMAPPEMTEEEKIEEQRNNLRRIAAMMGNR